MLNSIKMSEFQSYIFDKKPDIVILNETWLSKNIADNEIFPNQTYKVFRLDRSLKTHPMDPTDPNKYKKAGGGVLIAVKSDLDCESKLIKISCKAEMLSVGISLRNGKNICVSTLYRVGTLGAENHRAIDSYLKSLVQMKKYSKIILIGDINLNQVNWPDVSTSNSIQSNFLDTFSDINFEQLIKSPTHSDGRILDLLLTTAPEIISDIFVSDVNEVCKSDHFAIKFSSVYPNPLH